jgi:hypothetical protein
MKFRVTFKTPDALEYAAQEVSVVEARQQAEHDGATFYDAQGEAYDAAIEFGKKWVKYGEYVTIEFDTEAGTATVVPTGG